MKIWLKFHWNVFPVMAITSTNDGADQRYIYAALRGDELGVIHASQLKIHTVKPLV